MSGLRRIVHEIHRRSLWQVLGLYVVTSWVVIQVVDVLAGHLGLPEWVPPFAFILLLIGLPVVLATAFVQEGISPPTSRREPERIRAGIAGEGDGSGKVERATDSTSPSARHAVLTWRNAILGGVGAFALLGVLAVGYMALRALGIGPAGTLVAKGILEERERIIVAEFASASGDSSLATAVAQALRVDLSQSPTVVLVGQDRVASVLERMGHNPGERLEAGLAREVALRDGIKAVVTGQVDAAGSGYVLTVQLVVAADGQVLASAREAAADDDALIGAIDALSERLRERVGESVRSIRASPALERVTTSSLEALRSYSQAEHAHLLLGETDRAVSLLERAVALDTAFAMAWRKLGVLFGNRGERRSQSLTAFETALRHGERLPERERFLTLGTYYQVATGERDRALTAYENVLEIQPDDPSALHNLGGIYASLRDHARAIELYERAYAIDSVALTLSNVSIELANLGRWDESDEVRRQLEERFPENPDGPLRAALLSAARQRWDSAAAHYAVLEREHAGSVYWVSRASFGHAGLDAVRGRLADAEAHLRAARSAEEARELPAAALRAAVAVALLRLAVTRGAGWTGGSGTGGVREFRARRSFARAARILSRGSFPHQGGDRARRRSLRGRRRGLPEGGRGLLHDVRAPPTGARAGGCG